MVFFRKKPEAAPPVEEVALKSLQTRKDQELRNLGEIYYASTLKGKPDSRGLTRKIREIQRLDERLEAMRGAGPPVKPLPRETRVVRARPCVTCGAALTLNDRFCPQCGATAPAGGPAARPCPACNRQVDATAQFCSFCGASMAQPGRLRVRHPFTGQEVSFDFQHTPAALPAAAQPDAPSAPEEAPVEEDATADDEAPRQWIRDLERFARPSQVDSQAFVSRGREFLQVGRYREAAAEFEAAILQNPRDGRAHYHLGVARYKNGEVDAAMDAFERSTRLDRGNPDAHNDLGLCYVRKGQHREAVQQYQEALRIAPAHSDAHYNIAQIYVQQASYPDAIRHLQLYLQYSPRARDFKQVTEVIDRLRSGQRMGPESALPQH